MSIATSEVDAAESGPSRVGNTISWWDLTYDSMPRGNWCIILCDCRISTNFSMNYVKRIQMTHYRVLPDAAMRSFAATALIRTKRRGKGTSPTNITQTYSSTTQAPPQEARNSPPQNNKIVRLSRMFKKVQLANRLDSPRSTRFTEIG